MPVNPRLALGTADNLRRVLLIHPDWRRADPANSTWEVWFKTAGLLAIKPISHLLCSEESRAIQAGGLVQPFGPVLDYTYHPVEVADRPSSEATQIAKTWLMDEVRSEA